MTPHEKVLGAQLVLFRNPASLAHRRGSAFLARQAVEGAVRMALGKRESWNMTFRSRFILLRLVCPEAMAREGHSLWAALSEVCHYHPYDLVPPASDVQLLLTDTQSWINDVENFVGDSVGLDRILATAGTGILAKQELSPREANLQ